MLSSTKSRKVGNKSLQIFFFFFLATQICFAQWYEQNREPASGNLDINYFTTSGSQLIPSSDNGLIAYYPFNGNANDESGNGNHGTISGGIISTKDRFGRPNCAYSFDGLAAVISVDQSRELLNLGQNQYTICGWFNSSDTSKQLQSIFNSVPHTGICVNFNHVNSSPNRLTYFIGNGEPGSWTWSHEGNKSDYRNNQWHFFLLVKNATNYKFYVDGILDYQAIIPQSLSYNLKVGCYIRSIDPSSGGEFFRGSLDDFRIYNHALTDNEVQALFYEVPPPIHVHQPSGKEYLYIGTTYIINWAAYGLENVKIEYSTDAGSNWSLITESTSAVTGSYSWTVPNTPTTEGLVRISDAGNASIFDVSDSVFTVLLPPVISVIADSLGEDLYSGKTATHSITIQNNGGSDLQFSNKYIREFTNGLYISSFINKWIENIIDYQCRAATR